MATCGTLVHSVSWLGWWVYQPVHLMTSYRTIYTHMHTHKWLQLHVTLQLPQFLKFLFFPFHYKNEIVSVSSSTQSKCFLAYISAKRWDSLLLFSTRALAEALNLSDLVMNSSLLTSSYKMFSSELFNLTLTKPVDFTPV